MMGRTIWARASGHMKDLWRSGAGLAGSAACVVAAVALILGVWGSPLAGVQVLLAALALGLLPLAARLGRPAAAPVRIRARSHPANRADRVTSNGESR